MPSDGRNNKKTAQVQLSSRQQVVPTYKEVRSEALGSGGPPPAATSGMAWKHINKTVKSMIDQKPLKLLDNASGAVYAGEMLAVMGLSGEDAPLPPLIPP